MEHELVGGRFFLCAFNGSSNAIIRVESVISSLPARIVGMVLDFGTGEMRHTGYDIENLPLVASLGGELSKEDDYHFRAVLIERLNMFFLCSIME